VVTKKSYTIGVITTNHGQNTHQVNAGNNTQKGKNFKRNTGKPRSTNRQPVRGMKKITQKKPHSNPRTEQNETKTMDEAHMSLRKISKPSGSNYKERQEICMEEGTTKKWRAINKENTYRWKTQGLPLVPTPS
jgi:hypothetical protein